MVDVQEKIWLSSPHMGEMEQVFVKEAFDTNWVAPLGPNVNAFEQDISHFLGAGVHVAALSSGTAALHLGLQLLDVGPGDVVLCQSFTFSASANPICYLGATPLFVDSEQDTWNLSPALLEQAIKQSIEAGKKPKAIVAVHLYGMPYKVTEIRSIADFYKIPILEDSAEALGSTNDEQACGTFGDIAILSFNGNKIITTSGGGALVSNNENWINKARYLATQARDPAPHYQHSEIGYNYRMSNVCAGIGRGQMKVLDKWIGFRRANHDFYQEELSPLGFNFLPEPSGAYSNRWLTCALFSEKLNVKPEDLRQELEKYNIETRPLWKPMHLQPIFKNCKAYLSGVSENLFQKGLCLPSSSSLTDEQRGMVVGKIRTFIK